MRIEGLEARLLFAFAPAQPAIPPVVDPQGNSYVLGTDDLRMAVARYKPNGDLDTGWAIDGVHTMQRFDLDDVQDVPTSIVIDKYGQLFVAGSSNGQWAIGRVNIDSAGTGWAWQAHYFTGTVNALSLDEAQDERRLGVAGTTATGEIQVAVLYSYDTGVPDQNGGGLDTSFGDGAGYVTAPASTYRLGPSSSPSASASALVQRADLPFAQPGQGKNEWLVRGTVGSPAAASGVTRSRPVVVDFLPDGSARAQFDNARGQVWSDLFSDHRVNPQRRPGRSPGRGSYLSDLLTT
jgi:hypothetical protein